MTQFNNRYLPDNEDIGRHYLKTKLHLTEDRSLKNKFFCIWDYPTKEKPNEIWEIKSKQLPDYRPYAIDFRNEQIACVQKYPDKTWKVIVIFYDRDTKAFFIRLFDIRKDFLNVNRDITKSSGTIRLSLKYDKRDYTNHCTG